MPLILSSCLCLFIYKVLLCQTKSSFVMLDELTTAFIVLANLVDMFAMYIKHTILDKNHTEHEVQCSGCVPTYHSKWLISSSYVFIFVDCMMLVHIYVTSHRKARVNLP